MTPPPSSKPKPPNATSEPGRPYCTTPGSAWPPTANLRPYPADSPRNDNGFCPLPEELGVQLRRLSERLPDHDLAVSSNGLSTTDDGWRTEVLGETLDVLDGVVDDGANLVGYFQDTAIDGYEWRAGYETERGLISRDRAIKESGLLLSDRLGGTAT